MQENDLYDLLWSYRLYPLDTKATGVDYVLSTAEAGKAITRAKEKLEKENIYLMLDHQGIAIDFDKTIGFIRRFFIEKNYLCVDIMPMTWEADPIWEAPPDNMNIQIIGDVDINEDDTHLEKCSIYHLNVEPRSDALKHSRFIKYRKWYYSTPFIGPVYH